LRRSLFRPFTPMRSRTSSLFNMDCEFFQLFGLTGVVSMRACSHPGCAMKDAVAAIVPVLIIVCALASAASG
jgi:hypothetical protein